MNLPASWSDITLGQFIELYELEKITGMEFYEKELNVIAIVTGRDIVDLSRTMLLPEITNTAAKLKFLSHMDELPRTFPETFRIDGTKYRINKYVNTLSAGEYIDMGEYLKKGMLQMHYVMAVICKPPKSYRSFFVRLEETNGERNDRLLAEREARAQLFYNKMPAGIAYPLSVFFWNLWREFTNVTQIYLAKRLRKKNLELTEILKQSISGDGTE